MGCFFGCFGIKESRSNAPASPVPAGSRSKNALSSLFISDDEKLVKGDQGWNPVPRQLNDEVKFLKSYGESLETSTKTQNVLDKGNVTSPPSREDKSLKLSSWFSNASTDKSQLEKQSIGSLVAVEIREDCITRSGSFVESPSSCMTDRHTTRQSSSITNQRSVHNASTPFDLHGSGRCSETSSISPLPCTPAVKSPVKSSISVFSSEGSSSECVSQHPNPSELAGGKTTTPLKVTDELQTPATNIHAYIDDAYSVLRLTESSCDHKRELHKLDEEATLLATPIMEMVAKQNSISKETDDEGSLSSWFKPVSVKHDGSNKQFNSSSTDKVSTKTPGERPILGMVAAYWNEDEESDILPKWWDGNGIPNSTNKYKEDQKVSWHATPFEERLEKALSEETSISHRKTVHPVDFNETEDSDTAFSRLQSSSPPNTKPTVSFLEKGDTQSDTTLPPFCCEFPHINLMA